MGEGVCPSRRATDAQGRTAAAALVAGPAIPYEKERYLQAVITRHPRYYVARCPALPECVAFDRSRTKAYKAAKDLIRARIRTHIGKDRALPVDPVVSVKHLRLDITEIREELDLR